MKRYKFVSCFLLVFVALNFFTFNVFATGSYSDKYYNPNGGKYTYGSIEYEVCDNGDDKFTYNAPLSEIGLNDSNHSDCIRICLNYAKKNNKSCIISEYSYKKKSGNSLTPLGWHKYLIYLFDSDITLNSDGDLVLSTGQVFPKFEYSVQMSYTDVYGKDEADGKEYFDLQNCSFSYYSRNGSDLGKNDALEEPSMSCADLQVGEFKFSYPNDYSKLGGSFPERLQNIDYCLFGKMPFKMDKIGIGAFRYNETAIEEYRQTLCDNLRFTLDGEKLGSAMPLINVYGDSDEWNKQGYVCFKIAGTIQIPSSKLKVNKKIELVAKTQYISSIYTMYFNDNEYKSCTSNRARITVEYWKDTDGNGIDDVTGDTIPEGGIIDNNGDGNWDKVQGTDNDISDDSNNSDDDDTGLTGIVNKLNSFVKSIIKFFDLVGQTLETVSKLVLSIPGYISNIFNCFPQPIPELCVCGLAIIIFVSVLKALRG